MAARKLGDSLRDAVVYYSETPVQLLKADVPNQSRRYTNPDLYGYEVEVLRYGQNFSGRIFDQVHLMERPGPDQRDWIENTLGTRLAPFGNIVHAYNKPKLDPTQGDTKMALTPNTNALNPNTEGQLTGLNWLSGQPVHYTVGVVFEAGIKQYAYRVHPSLQVKEGDLVVVKGGTGYQLVVVATVHTNPSAKATAWVVSRVDTEFVERIQEETALLKSIRDTVEQAVQMETAARLAESNPMLKAQLESLDALRRTVTG